MSLLPYLLERQRQHVGYDDDLLKLILPMMSGDRLNRTASQNFGSIKSYRDKFQINLDVHHFDPEDISVKTADGFIIIEGNHEEKRDEHGWVSRQFCRRYALPENCVAEAVQSRLSSDGVLTVVAPLETVKSNERVVPIVQTGPVRKDNQRQEMEQ